MRYDVIQITRARIIRGWSQAELARRIKKSESTVSKIENGIFHGMPDTVKRMADELGLKMEDLILEECRK